MADGEQEPLQDEWAALWAARIAALTPLLGKPGDEVYHAPIPFFMGGPADVLPFPDYVNGFTYVTAELTGGEAGQRPNARGNEYELAICTRENLPMAANLVSQLGRYTCDAVLEPGETMDLGAYFEDTSLRALLFARPPHCLAGFRLNGRDCELLLCVGITAEELTFKRLRGSQALLDRLEARNVFPFTIPDRASVVSGFIWEFLGKFF